MNKNRHNRGDDNERVRLIDNKQKQNTNKQENEPISCGCVEIIDSEYWEGCKRMRIKDSQQKDTKKMERPRSRQKIRSPRMKASYVQYAPEGRRGNVYIDQDGRKIYKTSGKAGNSRRYVVMDDGELKRGERSNNVVYEKEETDYETVSEADSELMVPVRPKGEGKPTRRVHDGYARVLTKRMVAEDERRLLRTNESDPSGAAYAVRTRPQAEYYVRGNDPRNSQVIRTRPQSEYAVRENSELLRTKDGYLIPASRPASEIVVPSRERVVTRRVMDDSNVRESYITRSRPSSERRIVDNKEMVLVRRPRSEERDIRYVTRPREEIRHVRSGSSDRKPIGYVTKEISNDKTLAEREYMTLPKEYVVPRPRTATRDVGCQMTTNYIVHNPPKPKKLLRNVCTQTLRKPKERKIKTATRYYQTETVEVVQEPLPPTPREPTPPPRSPTPPPRILTPEPLPPPPPPRPKKKKKSKKREKDMQIVVKQDFPEPVYDRVEDLEVVPGASKIYYEAPKKEPHYPNPEPQQYAYYEPSEYSTSKKIVPVQKGIKAESISSRSSSSSSSEGERIPPAQKFYTIPLSGTTTFYGPYSYKNNNTLPVLKRKSKKKRKTKTLDYDYLRSSEVLKEKRRVNPRRKSSKQSSAHPNSPIQIETYLKRVPVELNDAEIRGRSLKSSLKRTDYSKTKSNELEHTLKRTDSKTKANGQEHTLIRTDSKTKANGPVQIEEYGATLKHGPSFYMKEDENGNSFYRSENRSTNPALMYINPNTEQVEPLKYSTEFKHIEKKHIQEDSDDEQRYVVVPGFNEHTKGADDHKDENPLVIIEDPRERRRSKSNSSSSSRSRSNSDLNSAYLELLRHDGKKKREKDDFPLMKQPKGKAHMVRVGGGWMKVEHHRNHHTPLKIYEIPRDANDDKFLYIKSRFNTKRDEVPIAYKKYREEIIRG